MKHHVAILMAGAMALTAGLLVAVETADDAVAATRTFSRAPAQRINVQRSSTVRTNVSRTNVNRTNISRTNVSRTNVNRTNISRTNVNRTNVNRTTRTTTKFSPSKQQFSNPNIPKNAKFGGPNSPKFGNIPKTTGITQFGPKGLKGPPGGIALGPKGPKGPNIGVAGPKGGPFINIVRGPRSIWWNGRLRTLVALSVLGGIYVGGTYFIADGYVPLGVPACRGLTPDGCQLTWRDVPTDDGGVIAQCVQFCPRRVATAVDAPVVAQPVAAPVAAVAQGCEISIHAEPNFGGVNSDVTADQPQLSQFGWDKAISSINIKSGTWDFYSDDNYGGQMIRLAPGQYATLAQGWDKTINSMMCAQP